MSRGSSIGSAICNAANSEESEYIKEAKKELMSGGKIRFRLTAHGFGGFITHWHIRHIKSGKLFIVLA